MKHRHSNKNPRAQHCVHGFGIMGNMKIHIGSDHAGFRLKELLRAWLTEQGHEVVDHGASEANPDETLLSLSKMLSAELDTI